jgi:hypothetical protein
MASNLPLDSEESADSSGIERPETHNKDWQASLASEAETSITTQWKQRLAQGQERIYEENNKDQETDIHSQRYHNDWHHNPTPGNDKPQQMHHNQTPHREHSVNMRAHDTNSGQAVYPWSQRNMPEKSEQADVYRDNSRIPGNNVYSRYERARSEASADSWDPPYKQIYHHAGYGPRRLHRHHSTEKIYDYESSTHTSRESYGNHLRQQINNPKTSHQNQNNTGYSIDGSTKPNHYTNHESNRLDRHHQGKNPQATNDQYQHTNQESNRHYGHRQGIHPHTIHDQYQHPAYSIGESTQQIWHTTHEENHHQGRPAIPTQTNYTQPPWGRTSEPLRPTQPQQGWTTNQNYENHMPAAQQTNPTRYEPYRQNTGPQHPQANQYHIQTGTNDFLTRMDQFIQTQTETIARLVETN